MWRAILSKLRVHSELRTRRIEATQNELRGEKMTIVSPGPFLVRRVKRVGTRNHDAAHVVAVFWRHKQHVGFCQKDSRVRAFFA